MNRILVVDDDRDLCDLLAKYLEREGLEVEFAHDGRPGVERALSGDFALVVLDVMLQGLNGFDALSQIRGKSSVPVLMLTARGDDVDRIVGLEMERAATSPYWSAPSGLAHTCSTRAATSSPEESRRGV